MELTSDYTAQPHSAYPLMPNFSGGSFAHHHTVHSALASLAVLGIGSERILLTRSGREARPSGTIVGQYPRAGRPIPPGAIIRLHVAGLGVSHSLPAGMWDSGGESAAGTREILEPFDDTLEKLRHWFHEGAPLFRIAPEDPAACARWLALFGVNAQEWPQSLWYPLASLIAGIPTLSCSQSGCAFVLDVLLGLPVQSFSWRRTLVALPDSALSALGARSSLLGIDTIVGDAMEDLASLEIEIGPVTLAIYEQFTADPEGADLLQRTLHMLIPVGTGFDLRWSVLDQSKSPRLGIPEQNARLGINTHMGSAQPQSAWSEA
jgi:hypothetical protein